MSSTLTGSMVSGSAVQAELPKGAKRDQLICWWWGFPIFYQIFGLIFGGLTKVMKPLIPGPTLPIDGIVAFTLGNTTNLQMGMILLGIFLGMAGLSNGLIVVQMRRMSVSPALAYAYIACGAAAALPGCYFCGLAFSAAVFRPDRDPQLVAMLYDVGFVGFIGCLGCFIAQYFVFGLAIFLDKNGIFPKWIGYMTIWNLVTELVAAPVWIFRTGPYSWNGLLSFYLGVVIFVVWIVCVITYTKKAIRTQPLDELEPEYLRALQAKTP